jgi:hypothetical protein
MILIKLLQKLLIINIMKNYFKIIFTDLAVKVMKKYGFNPQKLQKTHQTRGNTHKSHGHTTQNLLKCIQNSLFFQSVEKLNIKISII